MQLRGYARKGVQAFIYLRLSDAHFEITANFYFGIIFGMRWTRLGSFMWRNVENAYVLKKLKKGNSGLSNYLNIEIDTYNLFHFCLESEVSESTNYKKNQYVLLLVFKTTIKSSSLISFFLFSSYIICYIFYIYFSVTKL